MNTKILNTAILLLLAFNLFSQAPQKMSYQAVIRNASNTLVTNQNVGMRISIIQGNPGGSTVYQETQTPSSNINGLVSIEIGAGTVVSGTFSAIDWAAGPYFVKTETDPAGGTNYTITGTSQLLSVPYALHAGSANENDPVFDASVAAGITAADTANWNHHTDSTDIAAMGYVAGLVKYEVGDFAQGGVVFYVDETGQHGLVVAKNDLPTVRWFAGTYGKTRGDGNGIFAGAANTVIVIGAQVSIGDDGDPYAAATCNELQITEGATTYSDWYLPTPAELELLGLNYTIVDATATANGGTNLLTSPYWSSKEASNTDANAVVITPGGTSVLSINKAATFNIRAMRRF
ncbi:hypothetical protein [Fluviicola sp.]|uniref:hypothetical protein n=1 Tax=Fluviicola sp. TaxID=1917219 RepID=UPI0031DD23C9